MPLWSPALVVLVTAGMLAGCSSTGTPAPTAPSGSATSATEGLRGYRVPSLVCPTRFPTATPGPPQPITGEVQKYVICPPMMGNGVRPMAQPVGVAPADGEVFAALDQALHSPDIPPAPGSPCPAMAQMPRTIFARTTDGDWSVHLPTDSCGFFQAALVSALDRAER